jgi:TPR repeat protein
MIKLISNLLSLNVVLANKVRSIKAFEEGLAFNDAGEFKQAFPLMLESAELGHEKAMCLLGTMYLMGQGIAENGREALRWLEKSRELGYEESVSVLGMAYATGKAGIKIDLEKGREMLADAAERGDEQSARMLGMIDRGEGMFRGLKKRRR